MRITVLSGGIGGARFLQGLRAARPDDEITVVGNTADDLWVFGLRICPDLDSVMYTLGGGIDPERRWGRADEAWRARDELAAYEHTGSWFGLGDRDLATHLVRSEILRGGGSLSEATARLQRRWNPGVLLLPMSDDEIETQVRVELDGTTPWLHLQEFWIRHRGAPRVLDVRLHGIDAATPAPGVTAAIEQAEIVLFAPSNPVVSIGPIVAVPGIADALRRTSAPVVGVSPIIAGGHVRGMADQLLSGLGRENSAAGVAEHYGSRPDGLLDGWLIDEADAASVDRLSTAGLTARAVPLYMRDDATTRALAADAVDLAEQIGATA